MSFIVSSLHLAAFYIIITVGPVATREHFTISGAQGSNIAAFSTVQYIQYSTVQYSTKYVLNILAKVTCCNVLLSRAAPTSCNANSYVKWVVCKIIIMIMDNVGLVWWQYTAQFPLEEAGGLVLDLKVSDEDAGF